MKKEARCVSYNKILGKLQYTPTLLKELHNEPKSPLLSQTQNSTLNGPIYLSLPNTTTIWPKYLNTQTHIYIIKINFNS